MSHLLLNYMREPEPRFQRWRLMPSSVIRRFHYHEQEGALEILFTTGRRYLYHHVPPDEVDALRSAFSKGRYFNARIRDHYAYSEIAQ